MYSIRNARAHNERALGQKLSKNLAMLTLGLAALAGCQRTVPPRATSPVSNAPLLIDEAMEHRDWDRSTSIYANGDTVAGGTGYLWQTHETVPEGDRRYTDVPVAFANIVCMPVGVFFESPWGKQVYHGENVPPTYTAMPPLP
jgi:hypothetical protein